MTARYQLVINYAFWKNSSTFVRKTEVDEIRENQELDETIYFS